MEELIQLIVNNGLGIASFGALLYFMDKYLSKINTAISEVSKTLVKVQESLVVLSTRVDYIESYIKKGE